MKKECVAMLLAGGQGSRLYVLTGNMAKPAVPFGGKFRIIDFPLSNCVNSGIDTVGVLTQYRPLELNSYIGSGQPWDLDRSDGGVHILPPYMREGDQGTWYKGTANAIYQNMGFVDLYDPEYVLVLSGDHIYKMDYNAMLREHIKNGADLTIAVREVPWEEAPRFGILNTDENNRITEFEEKPAQPKSNKASMGVYIFSWSKMRKYLELDEANPNSDNDFGKNIIPAMLEAGENLYTYTFDGYWKDVGTIESLWEANMDLLGKDPAFDLSGGKKIYARNSAKPATFIAKSAELHECFVSEGCEIYGMVDFAVLFAGVVIEEGAIVRDSIIMPNTIIKKGAVIEYSIVGENCVIGEGAHIGERPELIEDKSQWGVAVIGHNVNVSDKAVAPPKAMISKDI